MTFIESELFNVSPLPPHQYNFDFKIQIVKWRKLVLKTKFININADQFKAIEKL